MDALIATIHLFDFVAYVIDSSKLFSDMRSSLRSFTLAGMRTLFSSFNEN
jgi:hypothetical protein